MTSMNGTNRVTGKALRNPEIMQAAIDAVRDGVGLMEAAAQFGVEHSTMGRAFVVLREAPGLVEQVLNGSLTLYKAEQIARKGTMHPCPVCEGKGYVFRKKN